MRTQMPKGKGRGEVSLGRQQFGFSLIAPRHLPCRPSTNSAPGSEAKTIQPAKFEDSSDDRMLITALDAILTF
jgi:hypothetical protein